MPLPTALRRRWRALKKRFPGRTPYHKVTRGYGGTYTFGAHIAHVGFAGCDTDLGVFFMIDDNRYFAAHIAIHTGSITPGLTEAQKRQRGATAVSLAVRTRLVAESTGANWGAATETMRGSLIVVGRGASRHSGVLDDFIRFAAADAMYDFLQLGYGRRRDPRQSFGLVVKRSENIKWEGDGEPSASKWIAVASTGAQRWSIAVDI